MEPEWMKKFSNMTVCNFFYVWFIVYAVFALLALVLAVGTFMTLVDGLHHFKQAWMHTRIVIASESTPYLAIF